MIRILTFLLIFLSGCSSASKRVDISIVNTTDVPLEVVASYGPFQQTVILWPHISWVGWLPVMDGKASVIIRRK